jgi:hypothetical protein
MDITTLVVVGVVAFMVVMIVLALGRPARRVVAKPALRPLAPEARDRYAASWARIEAHFVDAPEEAVREADALAVTALGERGHPLAEDKLPSEMRLARRAAAGKEGRGTEGLRLAMLRYRAVVEELAGSRAVRDQVEARREIAS